MNESVNGSLVAKVHAQEENSSAILFLLVIYSVLIVSINIISLTALLRCRTMCKTIRILSINMSITDLCFGCSLAYSAIVHVLPENCFLRKVHYISNSMFSINSGSTITLIAFDRFLSIYLSMRYRQYMTTQRLIAFCAGIWLVTLVVVLSNMQAFDCTGVVIQTGNGLVCYLLILSLCLVCVFYAGISVNIIKLHRHEKNLHLPYAVSTYAYVKSLSKVSVIILAFFLCYVPVIIYLLLRLKDADQIDRFPWFTKVVVFLMVTNALLNPVLYGWRYSECRKEILKIICRCNKHKLDTLMWSSKLQQANYLKTGNGTKSISMKTEISREVKKPYT